MMSSIDIRLEEAVKQAEKGRESWIKLTKNIKSDYVVVLFPSTDEEVNEISLKYTRKLAENKEKIIVLTHDKQIISRAAEFEENISVVEYSREEAEDLMRFYCLYQFTDKLIIASVTEPEGRKGSGLIGHKGITLEEVIAVGVFGMRM